MSYEIEIVGTGSTGNAVLIDGVILIDVGLTFKKLEPTLLKAEHIFITHRHGDHLQVPALSKLFKVRPWILRESLHCNADVAEFIREKNNSRFEFEVPENNIFNEHQDHFEIIAGGRTYQVHTFKLVHDVPNQGFVLINDKNETLIYASDTSTMSYAPAMKYDVIVVEGNYDEDKVVEAVLSDDYMTRFRATRNFRHLSVQQFEDFVRSHSKQDTIAYQLHESGTFGVSSNFGENNVKEETHG